MATAGEVGAGGRCARRRESEEWSEGRSDRRGQQRARGSSHGLGERARPPVREGGRHRHLQRGGEGAREGGGLEKDPGEVSEGSRERTVC